ncbi:MAG: type I-F CRISPR-associated protein Csy2, partial [Methylomarinum sp.]|nr:type I-F CRISPR-associated protein Csy2 [Methylomarinum sp.]
SGSTDKQLKALNNKVKRLTMPGFVLQDRSDYLKVHFNQLKEQDPNAELLTAWLDFSAMKYQAQPEVKDKNTAPSHDTKSEWLLQPKPQPKGWIVPIMTGYKAISESYSAGEVADTRDDYSPTCFVEAVHSIGEWKSMHRISNINEMIWRYQYENDWYLCVQNNKESQNKEQAIIETETIDFEAALNL